jgi:hypothetical protein
MDSLRSLLVQNQNNLDRLRARERYFLALLTENQTDVHKQYGPYADFWDEWYRETQQLKDEVRLDVIATNDFVSELREFIIYTDATPRKRTSKVYKQRFIEMNELAGEALSCQKDMLHIADTRISEHREFTERLLLVEAMDGLSEE